MFQKAIFVGNLSKQQYVAYNVSHYSTDCYETTGELKVYKGISKYPNIGNKYRKVMKQTKAITLEKYAQRFQYVND